MEYKKICPVCGKEFTGYNVRAKFCSSKCKMKDFYQRRDGKDSPDDTAEIFKQKLEDRDREKADREKLEAAAEAGDPLSRMKLAKKFSVEYWEAYRDYVNQFGEVLEVNEISTEDPEFPLKVALTVEELGVIRSSTKAHR